MPRMTGADKSASGGLFTSSGERDSATRAAMCRSRATTRSSGIPALLARSTSSPVSSSVRKIVATSADSTSHSRGTSTSRICSRRPWASAASSSICRPWTMPAMCSASSRAACSRKSSSRSRSRSARWLRSRTNTSSTRRSCTITMLMVTSTSTASPPLRISVRSPRSGGSSADCANAATSRSSWASRSSGRMITSAARRPLVSSAERPNSRSACRFHSSITPFSSIEKNALGAESMMARTCSSLSSSTSVRSMASRTDHRQQQPGDHRRADPQQPAHERAGHVLVGEHERERQAPSAPCTRPPRGG